MLSSCTFCNIIWQIFTKHERVSVEETFESYKWWYYSLNIKVIQSSINLSVEAWDDSFAHAKRFFFSTKTYAVDAFYKSGHKFSLSVDKILNETDVCLLKYVQKFIS